jgi:dipeptidyl aminopeptidase/acylaminoacyl peptidase
MTTCTLRRTRLAVLLVVLCACFALAQTKRPINHKDYDGWRNLQNQTLSRDGHFLAYAIFPQDGDGEVLVRNLQTGAEWRQPAGDKPEPPRTTGEEETPPPPPRITIAFTNDVKFVVFSTFPAKADVEAAKKKKAKAEDMPKNGMVVMELSSGAVLRVANVKNFQVPEKSGDVLAYLKEPAKAAPDKTAAPKETAEEKPAAPAPRGKKKEYGSDVVVRDLGTCGVAPTCGTERTLADVLEYSLTKDGALLVYGVSSKKEETNGLYAVTTTTQDPPRALLAGKGKYTKLAWDEAQKQLAFLSDKDDAAAKQPKFKLYLWARDAAAPVELVSAVTPGLRENCIVSDNGSLSFSRDGLHLFFGVAPPPPPEKDPDAGPPEDEKVSVDLWHWKDDYIQPMQKVRAPQERNRTYRAVFHLVEKKMVQLGDSTIQEITPSDDGLWAIGGDNRAYRPMQEYDTSYQDSYLIDTRNGNSTLLLKKHQGRVSWGPRSKYALYYDGKDWVTVSVPDAKETILTKKAGVAFWREDNDTPSTPPAHGNAGWTRDGKYVLLYDEFDIWRMTPDGLEAVNLTQGVGRKNRLILRNVRLNAESRDPDARWIDPTQPLLLRAEDKETRDTGFYRVSLDGKAPPQKLIMAAKSFSQPVKAKDADVLMLTASTFREFPDLQITDPSFSKFDKVTNANPQKEELLWGTAELIGYRNADGVPLKATLYKPENFDPKQKYPMLVYIYEKLTQGVNNFVDPRPSHNINPAYYVSNGYLVLEPDIVYTIGQPGQSALKCVLPAIDAVVDQGFVNEKAIGIQGHSWGGYQIAYMVTQTNRFRAAAAGAPVSNMTNAYDGIRWGPGLPRQFQYEHTQSRIGATLWQAPMKFIENSPIFMADRVQTPLMILHNDQDDAVPWYQGIEYYLALRRLGKEVYMFTYNGEPHGIRRRPNQKDYTVRLQQYFDHFLKGAPEPDWMKKGIPYLQRDEEKEQLKRAVGVY